ncbi:MFS transporter [Enteractinococcus coprophilus]|uniref:MFS transporter n=1 Tax=Enteractinococcus coprophilus TaxID=1027633 RepID=A0A543AG87_9MICC|nr:MFS transporter [Enteractinococcus coprophilus]TQL71582.1 MFS transporter [Enteractinococcus coprophilus]
MANQISIRPSSPTGSADKMQSADPATWSARRRKRYGWLITVMLLILMMISWADKAILGIVAMPLMEDLNISEAQFGLLGSAVFMLFGIAQLVAAPIANRVQAKWILLILCVIWSIAQVPVIIFASLPALWLSRLLLGAGEGPLAPITMHAVYKWFPAAKGATPAALASAGVTLGIVAFAPVLAWITASFGWKSAFIFVALIGVVWAAIWLFIGKEGPYTSVKAEREIEGYPVDDIADPVAAAQAAAADSKVKYRRSLLTPSWILAVLCSFFGYWTFTVATTWLPAYFENVLGANTQQSGSLIALPALWGAIATVGLSWLTEVLGSRGWSTRYSRGLVLSLSTIFSGVMVLLGTMASTPLLAIVCFTFGFGTAPALFALTYLVAAEMTSIGQRGAMLQFTNAFLTTGGLCAPMFVGILVGAAATPAMGYELSFLITGGVMSGIGLLAALGINQQRDRKKLGLDLI